ncbi:MAG TPA: trypsin-like serine protease, partial [bacterium]|nr:trypsin-like serine protease [bacterium]
MRKLGASALAVVVLSAAACGGMAPGPDEPLAGSANPIVGGTTDTGHPNVVLVLRTTGNSSYICTGTVIGPSVILTAGHCTQPDLDPTHYLILAGVAPFTHFDWKANATAIHPNPAYVGQSNTFQNDDGIIILDRIAPVTPMAWQQNNADAILTVGAAFTAVGYGVTTAA